MSDLNVISITGRTGSEPELRETKKGETVLNMSVACNGFKEGETEWFRVSVWGKQATALAKLALPKGTQVAVSGEFKSREFQARDGTKGVSREINAKSFSLIGSRKDAGVPSSNELPPTTTAEDPPDAFSDSEIPF